MTLQTIATKLKQYKKLKFEAQKKWKILSAKNTRIDTLIEFLGQTEYKLSIDCIKCSSVDDIRKELTNTNYSTYELINKGVHLTQYNNIIAGANSNTLTLLTLCEIMDKKPTLEKS